MAQRIRFIVFYVLCAVILMGIGFTAFALLSRFMRDVVHLHEFVDRRTYSTVQGLMVVGVYIIAFIASIPLAKWINKCFSLRFLIQEV